MGRRLDGFDIELTFDSDGKVATTEYRDGDGCGAAREFDPYATTLWEVVEHHLRHYKVSHKMTPVRMCDFVLPHPAEPIEYHCNREPHIGDDHELVSRRKK